jgi:hypothetical protein
LPDARARQNGNGCWPTIPPGTGESGEILVSGVQLVGVMEAVEPGKGMRSQWAMSVVSPPQDRPVAAAQQFEQPEHQENGGKAGRQASERRSVHSNSGPSFRIGQPALRSFVEFEGHVYLPTRSIGKNASLDIAMK